MRIGIYAFDGITSFHLATPQMVFGEVSRLGIDAAWETFLWSDSPGSIRTLEGYTVDSVGGPELADGADIIVVPSWPVDAPAIGDSLRQSLIRAHDAGAIIVGLCLGAFAVADTGILHGRSAVTHWEAMPQLSRRHPDIVLDDSVLYVDHGDVLTSAGTAAAIDACLHLIRNHIGAAVAARVARSLVVAPHREGGQAQYIDRPEALPRINGAIAEIQHWALEHLDEPLGVDRLAAHARMSRRSFIRKFTQETGSSPARWVLRQRIGAARALLESTDWGMDQIADACGFGSTVTFRQNFVAILATSPTSYRRQFTTQSTPTGDRGQNRRRDSREPVSARR
ncbi:GlxA family transcriptional regulator [Williamsia sp. R60]